jgi:hypothetical protein
MNSYAPILILTLSLMTVSVAHAADAAQEKSDCKQQEEQKGHGEKTSAVLCAVKAIFQSRVRLRKEEEPVEMTVGSPPMQTEDTETPGPNHWEMNVIVGGNVGGDEHEMDVPSLDINYGLGDNIQFTYAVPYAFAREELTQTVSASSPGFVDAHGVGDSVFGVKYRFYDNTETGLSLAIYPQIQFRTPGGNRRISDGKSVLIFPIIVTREFEHASISANAGADVSSGDHRYFASFGAGRRLSANVALLAEVVGTNLNVSGEKRVLLNVGLRRKISETQSISGSLGRDTYAAGKQHAQSYFNITYQRLFGE